MKKLLLALFLFFAYDSFAGWVDDVGILERPTSPTAKPNMGIVWVDKLTKDLMFIDSDGLQYNILLGGGIGGAKLNDLSDVDTFTASPTVGQALKFDGTQWVPGNFTNTLAGLSDVDTTTATTGEFLKFDGLKWVNSVVPQINKLDDIGDVNVTGAVANQVLGFNGTDWVPSTGGKTLVGTSPIVITQDANTATISLGTIDYLKIQDINDVSLSSVANGDTLVYSNGVWKNSPNTTVVGSASSFYLDDTASFADNFTLQITPSSYPQTTTVVATTSAKSPAFLERYVSGALGRDTIPAGTWSFKIYGSTSNTTGTNKIRFRVNKRVALSGMTGTFTGAGPTRTFTVSGGTPFVPGDANANRLLANLIETPTQTAWISGYTSSSVVTVTLTDPAFVNVSNVALNAMYYYLFNTETGDINSTSTPELLTVNTVQPSFTGLGLTDRIVLALFGYTDQASSRNITLYKGGSSAYTNFTSPISTLHNDMAGIQGGTASQYYHLTQAKFNAVENLTASGTMTIFSGDTQTSTGNNAYYGDSVTDGTVRQRQSGGALITEKRVSGSWVEIFRIDNL